MMPSLLTVANDGGIICFCHERSQQEPEVDILSNYEKRSHKGWLSDFAKASHAAARGRLGENNDPEVDTFSLSFNSNSFLSD